MEGKRQSNRSCKLSHNSGRMVGKKVDEIKRSKNTYGVYLVPKSPESKRQVATRNWKDLRSMHHRSAQVSPKPGTIAAYTFTVFEAFKVRPSCVRSRDGDIKGKVGKELATYASSTNENDNEEQRQVRREPWFLHLIFVHYRTDTTRKMCLDGEV